MKPAKGLDEKAPAKETPDKVVADVTAKEGSTEDSKEPKKSTGSAPEVAAATAAAATPVASATTGDPKAADGKSESEPAAEKTAQPAVTSEKAPAADSAAKTDDSAAKTEVKTPVDSGSQEHVVIATETGVLVINLFEADAPRHVENFKKLVKEGFYHGLTFHRVVKDFIAQAGSPDGTGGGGPGYTIEPEIGRKHIVGSVAMGRDPRDLSKVSNGSQFYICLKPHEALDRQGYTVFGQVIQGMAATDSFEGYPLDDVKNGGIVAKDQRTKILETRMIPAGATAYDEHAVLQTTAGEVVIDLFEDDTPMHAANFQKLVRQGFYNNLTFHRVIAGFMAQGGDPDGTGRGGPGYTQAAEIKRKHLRGSVAAARLGDRANPDRRSSGSQFYICFGPKPHLDQGGYTVFGQVVKGMENVDKIKKGPSNGVVPEAQRTVIQSARMVPASSD